MDHQNLDMEARAASSESSPVSSQMDTGTTGTNGTTGNHNDQQTTSHSHSSEEPQYIRSRVANACDGCKARKGKGPVTCHLSPLIRLGFLGSTNGPWRERE